MAPWETINENRESIVDLEKKTIVSKALAESSNFGENKTEV